MAQFHRITPCLWFDTEAEQAAEFYVSIFRNASIQRVTRFTGAGQEIHGQPEGRVMTVHFTLDGQEFTALNGGPAFRFNEAVSLQVLCETADEVDYYWERLTAGGGEGGRCGWLKDRYGLSWQVVPVELTGMLNDPNPETARRVTEAMLQMGKLDLAALKRAHEGLGEAGRR